MRIEPGLHVIWTAFRTAAQFSLLLLCQISFLPTLWAQASSDFPYRFKHPLNAATLTADSTTCLLQDHQGFIWMGTEKGLFRFEGRTCRHVFSVPDTSSDTPISALSQDSEQKIWIGTPDKGLYRLDPVSGSYTQFLHDPTDEESLSSNHISQLYLDQNQRLWISTADAGLCQFHFRSGTFSRYSPQSPPSRRLPTLKIGPIVADKSGNLFIGSQDQGIFCLPVKRQEFVALPSNNDPLIKNLSISSLFVDSRDILWIGTRERGLYQLGGPWSPDKQIKFVPLIAQYSQSPGFRWEINAIHESTITPNQFWIGTNNGLFLYNRETGQTLHAYHTHHADSLNGNQILSLLEDNGGTLWIGIASGKFDRIDLRNRFFITHKAVAAEGSLSQNHITAISRISHDPLKLLLGANEGTLTSATLTQDGQIRFIPAITTLPSGIQQFVKLNGHIGKTIILTQQHGLWLYSITDGEIKALKPKGLASQPHCVLPLPSSDAVLLGCSDGLYVYYPERQPHMDIEAFPHCQNLFVTLLQHDNKGGLYLAAKQGIYHMSSLDLQTVPSRFAFKSASRNNSPSDDSAQDPDLEISSFLCRYNGQVILGSRRHGLLKINGKSIESIRVPLPIQSPTPPILALFEDDLLQVWACTHEGVYMLSYSAKSYEDWTLFSEPHQIPMPLTGAGLLDSQTGQFFLSSAQGLLQIKLQDLILPSPSETLLISMVAIDQKSNIPMPLTHFETTPIIIPANYSTLELTFAVHDHYAPEKTRVSHRLFGRDRDWQLTEEGDGTVRYQKLAPGPYTLYVNGINAHRQRGSNGLIFYFDVHVPLLKRPSFWILTVLATLLFSAGLIWLIRTLRLRSTSSITNSHPITSSNMIQWASLHNMSDREMEIINLILAGKSNKEIEEALFISIKTVKSHIYNIYKKAHVKSRFELITLFTHSDNSK